MIQKTNVWKTAAGLLLTISMMISSVAMTAAAAEPADRRILRLIGKEESLSLIHI